MDKDIIRKSFKKIYLLIILILASCVGDKREDPIEYIDTPFNQEIHIGYTLGSNSANNDVRKIAVDSSQNIWAATGAGIFVKMLGEENWKIIQNAKDRGPSFDIAVDKDNVVWISTWKGIYRIIQNQIEKIEEVIPPVSSIAVTTGGLYAFGFHGIWQIEGNTVHEKELLISKGIKNVVQGRNNNLWLASNVGLYHYYENNSFKLFQDTTELISCYVRDASYSPEGNLWVGCMGGVTIRSEGAMLSVIAPSDGIPNGEINCIERAPNGSMWIGTDLGIVRFYQDGSHSLRFTKRWLKNDEVRDIKFDKSGTAWIATANGVSAIKSSKYTLKEKADYFYDRLIRRHVRDPWIIHRVALEEEGDTSTFHPEDDDNDGEYTGIYLSMESLRYATTGDILSRERSKKAFHTLMFLQEVTETDGFFARTVIPVGWEKMNDPNRKYSEREVADEIIKDPRFKRVEERWRKSKDGKWLWKGDTSSDEMCGHFMGYFYYYEYAADEAEKKIVSSHTRRIMDYLIENDYNFLDIDGKHTRWAVWSPNEINRDPDWAPERYLNSFELLSYLKFTYHITGEEKYQIEYLRLIDEEGYLKNASNLNHKNPAWEIYFDTPMAGYLFPILVKYETDPTIKKFYEELMDEWFEKQRDGHNPMNNFIYCLARGKVTEVKNSIDFLIDTPLDLVDWRIDHTKREDISIVRRPILEEKQTSVLPPASERATVRWDKNPWSAVQGNPYSEREPVFWLLPYWMGKYLEIIKG